MFGPTVLAVFEASRSDCEAHSQSVACPKVGRATRGSVRFMSCRGFEGRPLLGLPVFNDVCPFSALAGTHLNEAVVLCSQLRCGCCS